MIEYLVPTNIDDRVITRSERALSKGGLLAVPTDTTWSVVCSYKSPEGIKRLKKIAGKKDERLFTLICSSIAQISEFCSVDNTRFRLIKQLSPGPYVFILNTLHGTEKTLNIRRKEAGVRIPASPILSALIEAHGSPLYSVTAKKSMARGAAFGEEEDLAPDDFPPLPEEELFSGSWELETLDGVDLILDGGEEKERCSATILDLTENEIRLVRAGLGGATGPFLGAEAMGKKRRGS
jgi:tRNA threonylcarbamoyl adenosine modification protein (Sua5/YciO/YrdC/YwlC family)